MAEYDAWATYYDLVHQGLEGEEEFYVGQAVRRGGKTLELGVGTGRIAIAMAMSGVDVTGVDNSEGMLSVCREKLALVGETSGSLTLEHADMATLDLGQTFDLAVMPYRAFMHLHEPARQRSCLQRLHRHLNDGARLILNTWMPSALAIGASSGALEDQEFTLADEYPLPGSANTIRHYHRAVYRQKRQTIHEEHLLDEIDPAGQVVRSETLPMLRVWTTFREMDLLVREAGFQVEAIFGDFNCNPLTETSPEMIWALRL